MNANDFYGRHAELTKADIVTAAQQLGVEPATIKAVFDVEAAGAPFLPDGRPKILFEAHKFGAATNYKYSAITDPNGKFISAKAWDRRLYGAGGAWQYTRLLLAMKYDEAAALKSTSWGAFQILGSNFSDCDYDDVYEFVKDMCDSAGDQLLAFCQFVNANELTGYLKSKNWAKFARAYNGPAYKDNDYDDKLAAAYHKELAIFAQRISEANHGESPSEDTASVTRAQIAAVQAALNALHVSEFPLTVDGYTGPKTNAAISAFQVANGLKNTGTVTKELIGKLGI